MSLLDTVRDRPRQTLLALAMIIVAAVMLYDWIVVSEEERIEAMIQSARDQYVAGQVGLFMENFDPAFSSTVTTLRDLENRCRSHPVADATVNVSRVELDGNDTSRARARIRVAACQSGEHIERTTIQLELRRDGERWRILGAKLWGTGM